jgi:hypothetical protein
MLPSLVMAGEWVELFNGKNLRGWKKLDGTAEFRVEDGEIVGVSQTGTPNTFLATRETYNDFILEYEMKMDRGLNSGVQFRSKARRPDGTERVNGYQVECDDHEDRPWAGGIYEEAGRGWLYPMSYHPGVTGHFKKGQWNHVRVEAVGNTIRTFVNGISFANLVDDKRAEGFIALQVHSIRDKALEGKEIRWRGIRILTEKPEEHMKANVELAPQVSYLVNRLTEWQEQKGWKLLWDGKTTLGWRGAGMDHFPDQGWTIRDGILTLEKSSGGGADGGGDIITEKLYGDFILELDFRITPGANSGIKYIVDPELNREEGYVAGCEYQILDDAAYRDEGLPGKQTLASLYDLIEANALLHGQDNRKIRFNGTGSWNRARIEVRGNRVTHSLNGVKVVEYERGTQMWKALVAFSKFKQYPGFGEAERGRILLQDHGHEVSFRTIKIREP